MVEQNAEAVRPGKAAGDRNQRSGAVRPGGLSVLVDARALMHSGIGRYLREILDRLLADSRFGTVKMLGHPEEIRRYAAERPEGGKVEVLPFPFPFYSAPAQLRWMALSARGALRADVAFFPHYDVPLPPVPAPFVVTVQDLSHWRLAELFPTWKRTLGRVVLARAVQRAARVLVTSRSTWTDLVDFHPRVRGKVDLIPLGVGREFLLDGIPVTDPSRPYLLCVGNRKPHKNMVAAVEVLARLREACPGLRLVVAGHDFGEDDDVARRAVDLGVSGSVEFRTAVDDADLRDLYAGAACLLFPSLYEGFGLPAVEAMGCGTPVVASNRASIPEVCGGAALLAEPDDHGAMAAAVRRVITEPALRAELAARGRARARELSWDATAAGTLEILVRAAATTAAPRYRTME
jgi:glycosyltransferase involved in cell wall biosynthesis